MTVIGVLSVKHAPGATTAAVAIATASVADAVVIECDPAGGDIAARGRLGIEPGLVNLAAAGRHPTSHLDVLDHCQHLATGVPVVVAPSAPEQASAAVAGLGSRLPDAIRSALVPGIIDLGRWTPTTSANAALAGCDEALVAIEPTVAGVEHLRTRLDGIRTVCSVVSVLLIGERPYGPSDVESVLDAPVAGVLAVDPRGVALLYGGRKASARRSALVRSAAVAGPLRTDELSGSGADR